ncbi:MAG: hypothetical protein QOK10_3839 [Pseudonocardiales bacterium]|nr:hypothetical protein [Pseudonocardiales bacterium]
MRRGCKIASATRATDLMLAAGSIRVSTPVRRLSGSSYGCCNVAPTDVTILHRMM